MKLFYQSLPVVALALALAAAGAMPVRAAAQNDPVGEPYPAPYSDLRGLVDRTQNDLRMAAELEHEKSKQRDRYLSAQGHLSSFDRHLVKGKFDRGELDKARGEIKGILDHNVLQASSRDALLRDMDDLTVARDRHY
jgi:hypothetical protein